MIAGLLRRIATSLALAWIVATIVFLALHLVPGDPAELLLSTGGVAPDLFPNVPGVEIVWRGLYGPALSFHLQDRSRVLHVLNEESGRIRPLPG